MKLKYIFGRPALFAALAALALTVTSCVTRTYSADPSTGRTNVVYVPSAGFEQTVAAIRTAAPMVPAPFGELLAGVLTAITAAVATYAHQKTKHANSLKKDIAELKSNQATNNTTKS
ncbi:MAG TPA: hypothetical protein VN418_07620 [Gammaproteobacteria bacterium]|nr:hypothetical protein [Gammaproteobacteria bacterium]